MVVPLAGGPARRVPRMTLAAAPGVLGPAAAVPAAASAAVPVPAAAVPVERLCAPGRALLVHVPGVAR